jgi:hypothetical protein
VFGDNCITYSSGYLVNVYWLLLVGIAFILFGDVYSWYVDYWFLSWVCNFNVGICMKISLILVILLSGCAQFTEFKDTISINQFTETKNIYYDNTAVNNYVGNPCAFYVGSRCIFMKNSTPRNPDLK